MTAAARRPSPPRSNVALTGLALVAAGVLLYLHRAEVLDAGELLRGWWPLLVVAGGSWWAVVDRAVVVGTATAAAGVLLLAAVRADLAASPFELIGPSVLMVCGCAALLAAARLHRVELGELDAEPRVTAVFGDARATVGEDALGLPHVVTPVLSVFGDVHVELPAGWRVDDHVTAVLGTVRTPSEQPHYPESPTLRLEGLALFGDVRVRHLDEGDLR